MVKPKTRERRKFVRARRVLTIEHRLYKRKGILIDGSWNISKTEDMSIVGLLFSSDIAYLRGDIIQLRVVMSGLIDVFHGFGRVIRTEQKKDNYFVAVAFVEENSAYLKQ